MSWPLNKLKDITQLIDYGLTASANNEVQGPLFLRITDLTDSGVNWSKVPRCECDDKHKLRNLLVKGDIVFARTGATTGKSYLISDLDEDTVFASYLIRVRPNKDIFSPYLAHFFKSPIYWHQIGSMSSGATLPGVNASKLGQLEIPLPPLDEQKRIAAILDKADAIRRKRQQAIQLADDFLRSVFLDMFGDPVTNPKGWEVKQVGKVVDCIVPGRDKPKSFTGGMPWITTNDLNHLGSTYESEKSMGLSDQEIAAVKARIIPKNSVLMTCVGDLGVISIAGNDMVMNQQLHAFLPNENIEKEFLMYALSFQKHYMIKMASSTTVPYMNKTVCNSVPVILPAIEMQKKFTVLFKKASLLRKRLISTQSSKRFLFNSLSQKAFAGEL